METDEQETNTSCIKLYVNRKINIFSDWTEPINAT